MNYTRPQINTILLLYITILSFTCYERSLQQKIAETIVSFTLPLRVLKKKYFRNFDVYSFIRLINLYLFNRERYIYISNNNIHILKSNIYL